MILGQDRQEEKRTNG